MKKKNLNPHHLHLLAIISFLLALILVTIYLLPFFFKSRIYPKTFAADLEIALMKEEEALSLVQRKLNEYLTQPIAVAYSGSEYFFTLKELGVSIDYRKLAADFRLHRGNNIVVFYLNSFRGQKIEVRPEIDLKQSQKVLLEKIDSLKLPEDARYQIDEQGKLFIVKEEEGESIDFEIFSEDIKKRVNTRQAEAITLHTTAFKPAINEALLTEHQREIERRIGQTVTLTFQGKKWPLDLKKNPGWWSIEVAPIYFFEDLEKEFRLDVEKLKAGLDGSIDQNLQLFYQPEVRLKWDEVMIYVNDQLMPAIEIPTTDVKITKNESGIISFEGTARNGRGITPRIFFLNLELAINNQIKTLEVPTKEMKAKVEADEELIALGIKNLIATGYSNFTGSTAGRKHNIRVGMSKYDGLLIAPGEVFSFNKNLGNVDANSGYLKELVIKQGETTPEYGGGVCQVSSTVYRAAFFGGLPIEARRAHSFAVSYYARPLGYGLDATIYLGGQDLKFRNDTPGYILMQTYTSGDDAVVKLYGTDDERKVYTDGPYISNKRPPPPTIIQYTDKLPPGQRKKAENAIDGFDAAWNRTVVKGGSSVTETFKSFYKPWTERILVGAEKEEEKAAEETTAEEKPLEKAGENPQPVQ